HMVEGGMKPQQAIAAATSLPAEWLGMSQQLGTVEAGKHADLIAMPDDPGKRIEALRGIAFVMKAGHVYRNDLAKQA
ncbi:MAG: amidohydrolase family protein, partial [Acidimicrobiia bacterium]